MIFGGTTNENTVNKVNALIKDALRLVWVECGTAERTSNRNP